METGSRQERGCVRSLGSVSRFYGSGLWPPSIFRMNKGLLHDHASHDTSSTLCHHQDVPLPRPLGSRLATTSQRARASLAPAGPAPIPDGRTDHARLLERRPRAQDEQFELRFHVGDHFEASDGLSDVVPVRFAIFDAAQHYHVPHACARRVSSYSTYRGLVETTGGRNGRGPQSGRAPSSDRSAWRWEAIVRRRDRAPFGAVIARQGKIIARAANQVERFVRPHRPRRDAGRAVAPEAAKGTEQHRPLRLHRLCHGGYPCPMSDGDIVSGVERSLLRLFNEDGAPYGAHRNAAMSRNRAPAEPARDEAAGLQRTRDDGETSTRPGEDRAGFAMMSMAASEEACLPGVAAKPKRVRHRAASRMTCTSTGDNTKIQDPRHVDNRSQLPADYPQVDVRNSDRARL